MHAKSCPYTCMHSHSHTYLKADMQVHACMNAFMYLCMRAHVQNPRGFLSYKSWKKRWFKLDEFMLQYFEHEGQVLERVRERVRERGVEESKSVKEIKREAEKACENENKRVCACVCVGERNRQRERVR